MHDSSGDKGIEELQNFKAHSMFDSIKRYIYDRRRGLIKSAVLTGGTYAISLYVHERLEEMKEKVIREKAARDSLRRRFQTTHDDVCFTIMALIPTLASQILEDMDVEALTNELQSISRASRSRSRLPSHTQDRSQSVASSVTDTHSDAGSVSLSSYSGSAHDADRGYTSGLGSWVEPMSISDGHRSPHNILASTGAELSDSITSTTSSVSHNGYLTHSMESLMSSNSTRTKRQLWNEIKILALTRTLTTLYTTTLLTLLSVVQITLLGRGRYIDSVRASERAERARDRVPPFSLTGILAREAIASIIDVEAIWPVWLLGEDNDEDDEFSDGKVEEALSEETELRYLTLSWWILHVGWKDVAERVRGSVESVFEGVSLQGKLSASELYVHIMDIRRRVELDATGHDHSLRFMSSLLPPTPETTAHVLAQGGALPVPPTGAPAGSIQAQPHESHHDRLLTVGPPYSDFTHSSASSPRANNIEPTLPNSEPIHDGLTPATAIVINNQIPRPATFPTPPSSNTYEPGLSSCASPAPSISSVPAHVDTAAETSPPAASNAPGVSFGALDLDPRFNKLLVETRGYLSGPDFAHALGCALDRATEVLMDGLRARVFVDTASAINPPNADAHAQPTAGEGQDDTRDKQEVKIRLAGLLPGLARWSPLALNSTPNELIDNILAVREVNALEAIIISDYQDHFSTVAR
ncbi:hypothetical protein PAXRUDRAFT_26536 [Paxillus rubicundulus Ve08.2h10]|uniref:Peroxisomal biogenesis factor 3 n=1 Tax=Paxillus rubicundulus Ve08.2h10 TaxID=930991 RepID=A0A0D0DUS6_9AGAM|nr:hypothetical protein PAXRUDRAFT_26536 [Paxillus rubicundulus Ve08.2h10]